MGIAFFVAIVALILNAIGLVRFSVGQFQWLLPASGLAFALVVSILVVAGLNLRRMSMPLDELFSSANQVAEGN